MRLARCAIWTAVFVSSTSSVYAQSQAKVPRPFLGPSTNVPRSFPGPTANVPAPLGTPVPVIFDRPWRNGSGYGYGYGYGGVAVGLEFDIGANGAVGDPVPFVGVGPGYWWQNYNGFYGGSGFSMYGPPIPTYAPVPGMFGGSDQRFMGNNPGPFYPVPSTPVDVRTKEAAPPAPVAPSNIAIPPISVPLLSLPATPIDAAFGPAKPLPPTAISLPFVQQSEPPILPKRAKLQIDLVVPPYAQVFFDNEATSQTGRVRSYISSEKNMGDPVEYSVRVEWIERGTPMSKTRKVTGKAGERIAVDFTRE